MFKVITTCDIGTYHAYFNKPSMESATDFVQRLIADNEDGRLTPIIQISSTEWRGSHNLLIQISRQ